MAISDAEILAVQFLSVWMNDTCYSKRVRSK